MTGIGPARGSPSTGWPQRSTSTTRSLTCTGSHWPSSCPTRDQLARQLRAAGDREAARHVAALRRPSISAWAANQLAQAAPTPWPSYWKAGATLRQAQHDALAGQPEAARRLRATGAQLRAAMSVTWCWRCAACPTLSASDAAAGRGKDRDR
jgi:hypothetical protein